MILTALYWVILGFVLGAILFSLLLGRLFLLVDIRHSGDGNPGAANAWRAGTWRLGVPAVLLDFLKGKKRSLCILVGVATLALLLGGASACQPTYRQSSAPQSGPFDAMPMLSPVTLSTGQRLRAVATTSIVADVVRSIGGDDIELVSLIPLGADPHSFVATPQNLAALMDAHVVFVNGLGLEASLQPVLADAIRQGKVVPVSFGIELLEPEEAGGEDTEDHLHNDFDPHTWMDPTNVATWVLNIERALIAADPAHGPLYRARAEEYTQALFALDEWIQHEVQGVSPANRKLVTDHTVFTYFAQRYGFEQVGAVLPGYSTVAQPSAQELARLESAILANDVKAIFVGRTVNPALARQVAEDTGRQLVFLYTGSLSEAGGPADTYLTMMRYNVSAIVQGLR
ncbi:MAG: zinc ABC transporter substrate-binding protein [Chloroflexi bacterium]|nr:zinc ABC transporter substrate-binding protein [Chloroflexota bacterium]